MAKSKGNTTNNTTQSSTNSFNKGMVKDYTEIFIQEGLWTHAVNAINNAHNGETGSIGNEPSNEYCTSAPYDIIGFTHKSGTEWVIFSTNNLDSEIGIFDQSDCSYTTTINDRCLGFKTTNLIKAAAKENYDCTYSVYWQDGLNPDRQLNLDDVPYICEPASEDPCDGEICTDRLDCDAIRLHPLVQQPCLKLQKAKGDGQLNNGSYTAFIAYSENGVKLTDYSMPSLAQTLWRNEGIGGGLELEITNLDPEYDEYELVILGVVAQQAIAKKIGYYSTNQTKVTIDLIQGSMESVPIANLPLRNVVYEKSDALFEINGYLIRTGVTTQPEFNYQPLANQIVTKWVASEYDTNYYWNGGNLVGYYRDEVYSFFIRWVYKTGARSSSYHIPGRAALPTDLLPVTGSDVIYPNETERWQVYDTSTLVPASGTTEDGGQIIAEGKMGYWESTERYPVNPTIWGDLCNEPIRHHKMPSNEQIHIHNNGGTKIYILGVAFENIQHPVDNNGNPISDIVGYEILRGSREGNRSIVAKGIFANMVEFPIQGNNDKKGLFANYPWNDIREEGDPFLTPDYTVLDNNENEDDVDDSERLNTYKRDYFSFHCPEVNFIRPAVGGNHIKIYKEQYGTATGRFEIPYQHPRFKLLTNFAFILAAGVGLGIALVDALGKTTMGPSGQVTAPFGTGTIATTSREGGPAATISDLISSGIQSTLTIGGQGNTIGIIAGIALFIGQLSYWWPKGIDVVLDIIRGLSSWRDYYLQYNGIGFYKNHQGVTNPDVPANVPRSIRRAIPTDGAQYIGSYLQDFDATYRVNNLYRTKYLCLKTEEEVPNPQRVDNSKKRITEAGLTYKNPTNIDFDSNISSYYGALKVDYQNQYAQIDSIVQIPTGSCIYNTEPLVGISYESNVIFGGDVFINRYTEKNAYFFFGTWMVDFLDGTEFNYTQYVNGPAPRYYAIFQNFDVSDFDISFDWTFPQNILPDIDFTTPSDLYRLDEQGSQFFVKRHAWAYMFYNGVRDYFTESELNMAYRDYEMQDWEKFYDVYGNSFNDVSLMFRSDIITKPTYYKYDLSLSSSRLFLNLAKWGKVLPRDYDPELYSTCFQYYPKRAVYSLQQQSGLKRDNWRNYLPLNFKDFGGKINTIKSLNATGAVILFNDKEPIQFIGVDQLQLAQSSTKVTIGDGGLFQQSMQSLANADDALNYGSSISSRGAVNTPFGLFYISQNLGKIMQFGGSLDEISRNGMKFWFAENLPSQMLEMYPDYPLYDNPVAGVGCQAIYDPTYELVYFTKKDYKPLRDDLRFDDANGVPYYVCGQNNPGPDETIVPEPTGDPEAVDCTLTTTAVNVDYGGSITLTWTTENATSVTLNNGIGTVSANGSVAVNIQDNTTYFVVASDDGGNSSVCSIEITVNPIPIKCPCPYDDPTCFEPCDWTISYDPKTKLWVSFHDWHPNLMIPSYKHFYTAKGSDIWKHNDRWDSYCNYYGQDYPWEIEYPVVTPNVVTVLKSVEYTLDVYKYYNDGRDYFHILDENFDRAIVYNSEQISGLLRLTIKGKNSPLDVIKRPTFNGTSIDVLYSKEENKFRFNQFWDITNERGEFVDSKIPMWITDCSGYKREINPAYVNYQKEELERKKFRHYGNKLVLRKNISGDKKMILKLTNAKQTLSPR